MATKKKTATLSPIQQLIAYAAPKTGDKSTLSLPVSETENIDIEVKRLLGVDDMASFVTGVTNALFLNDTYMPTLSSLVIAKAIVAYYTNLEVNIPNESIVSLVFNTEIISKIKEEINESQFCILLASIDKSIEFKKQEILNTQSARLEESIRQIEFLTEATAKITEQFDGIDMKEATDAAIKLSNIPERELVNNILDVKFGESASDENSDEIDEQLSFDDGDMHV